MRKLSALDLAFFLAETKGSPKHVAGLMLCRKPAKAPRNFTRDLVRELKSYDEPTEPFNLVIRLAGLTGPHWQKCEVFDIDEHVFYHKPKKTSTWQEVLQFVARLHEPVLDRSRPLWEFHVIDGIEGGRFAVYTKVHHAYADGVTMSRWISESMAKSADDPMLKPAWVLPRKKEGGHDRKPFSVASSARNLNAMAWNQIFTAGGMAKLATQQTLEKLGITRRSVSVPFSANDDSPLIGDATPGRSLATTWIEMEDIKQVGKKTRATLNHVALSCIDGALHRYLDDTGNGIDHPITIQMPVDLRRNKAGKSAGNNLGVALVELAAPTDDPFRRLNEVGHSLSRVRDQIDSVPGNAFEQYTVMLALTGELIDKLNLSNRIPANGHTLVSNLPGPPESLYLKGAAVEQYYPLSLLVPGLRTNITLFSCGGILNFGIVATRDLPELQMLADFIREEFEKLQEAVLAN
jgi:WS/DGAT/MGAT family acyltransferase